MGVALPRPPVAVCACVFFMHACPISVFRVADRVSSCARAAGQAGRPDFLRARPAGPAGRLVRGRSCTSPDGRRRPLCCAVLCCAVLCCAVLCCAVHGRAPAGSFPASPRGRMRPVSVCKSMGLPAPVRGRPRPRTSPRGHVHGRRPAPLGRRRDACTTSTRYPWKSAKVFQLFGQLVGRHLLEHVAVREV